MKSNSKKKQTPSQSSWYREIYYRELELEVKLGLPTKRQVRQYNKLKSEREKSLY